MPRKYSKIPKGKVQSFLVSQREKLEKQQEEKTRIEIIKERIKFLTDPEDIMVEIIDDLKDVEIIPNVGDYYTFIYNAKTPNIVYDQHPLIATFSIHEWGFSGFNFHWNKMRNYTWQEVAGNLHVVNNDEIIEMRNINYAKFLRK